MVSNKNHLKKAEIKTESDKLNQGKSNLNDLAKELDEINNEEKNALGVDSLTLTDSNKELDDQNDEEEVMFIQKKLDTLKNEKENLIKERSNLKQQKDNLIKQANAFLN